MLFPDDRPGPAETNSIIVTVDADSTGEKLLGAISKKLPDQSVIMAVDETTGSDYWDPEGKLTVEERCRRKSEAFTAAYGIGSEQPRYDVSRIALPELAAAGPACFCGEAAVTRIEKVLGKTRWLCAYHAKLAGDRLTPVKTAPRPPANAACPCGSGKKFKRCCRLK